MITHEERRFGAVSLHQRGKKLDGNSSTFLGLNWRIIFELTLKAQGVRTRTEDGIQCLSLVNRAKNFLVS